MAIPMQPNTGDLSITGAKRLLRELEILRKEESVGIRVELATNGDGAEVLNEWNLYLDGPSEPPYEGHVLHAKITFPGRYPFQPPKFVFVTKMFHPNIYSNGNVCISILHTDRDEPLNPDIQNCTWTPSQTVRTVCISILSLLTSPNISSPANVDASVMLRDHPDEFNARVKELLDEQGC
ncbi:ubiquitin-conjugating enzyme E2 R [Pancytospora philotis]|nr:ubiquitin-conjugating enzyme E2 R [Pancytospora philotis]